MINERAFWDMTKRTANGCFEWQGYRNAGGYGRYSQKLAHRLAYSFAKGDPGNLTVCHTCDNPPCCNPDHLWLGTQQDNLRDAMVKGRLRGAGQTHCKQGHEFTEANTYRYGKRRFCRTCNRAASAAYNAKRPGRS